MTDPYWGCICGLIGLIQSIIHDYERINNGTAK